MASGSGDIRAGGAFVEIYGKDNALSRTLAGAQKKLQAWGSGISSLGTKMAALGAAVVAPLAVAARHFAETGDGLDEMSARTGLTTNALSELGYAAELSGGNLEVLEGSIRKMQKAIVSAVQGSDDAQEAFQRLGLRWQDLAGMSGDAQLEKIADGLARIHDPTVKADTAMKIFGKTGTTLLPLLAGGAEGLRAFRQEARDLGLSVDPDQAKSASELADAWDRLGRVSKAVMFAVGSAIAPIFQRTAEELKTVGIAVKEWVGKNQDLIVTVLTIAKVVAVAGAGVFVLGKAVSLLGSAFGILSNVVGLAMGTISSIVGILLSLASPIGLVVIAIGGLGAAWATMTNSGQKAVGSMGALFADLQDVAGTAFAGIKAALAAGDWSTAAKLAGTAIRIGFSIAIDRLADVWREFRDFFVDLFWGMVNVAAKAFAWLWVQVKKGWAEVRDAFADIGDYVFGGKDWYKKINQREQDRKQIGQDAEKEMKATQDALQKDFERGVKERTDAREKKRQEGEAEIEALKKEMAEASQQAIDQAAKAKENAAKGKLPGGDKVPVPDELEALSQKTNKVFGTFNAAAAAMNQGRTDVVQKQQLDQLRRIDEHVQKIQGLVFVA